MRTDIARLKSNKLLNPNVIYTWIEKDVVFGTIRIVFDGFDELFGYGYKIEDNPAIVKKRDLSYNIINQKRAFTQVKIQLLNTYNALRLYGKKILDNDGNIDWKKYMWAERVNQNTPKNGIIIDLNESHPIIPLVDFKSIKEITYQEACNLGINNNG